MRFLLSLILVFWASLASAQMDLLTIADDVFASARSVEMKRNVRGDAFLTGMSVDLTGPVQGSAHIAARSIETSEAISGNLYAAGMNIEIDGPVGGNASLFGYVMEVGDITGNLRAAGSEVTLAGEIGGYALLTAEEVSVEGSIAGDLHLMAKRVKFDDDAQVSGTVVVYEDYPGQLQIPASVASEDRIERREVDQWQPSEVAYDETRGGFWSWVGSFLTGLIVIVGLTALAAALAPQTLATLRRRFLEEPKRALLWGVLGLSTAIGFAILLAVTVIGLIVAPFVGIAAGLIGFAGYVVGVYAFGVWFLDKAFARGEPVELKDKVIAAAVGAALVSVIGLIPVAGWLFALLVTFAGIGSIILVWLRPRFFVA